MNKENIFFNRREKNMTDYVTKTEDGEEILVTVEAPVQDKKITVSDNTDSDKEEA